MGGNKLIIYTDGAARGNPGKAGIGLVIYGEKGEVVKEASKFIGITTNNVAEYTAFIYALREAKKLGGRKIEIYSDSELLVKQLKGKYKVKDEKLKGLYRRALNLLKDFEEVNVDSINREENERADKLANQGIEDAKRKGKI